MKTRSHYSASRLRCSSACAGGCRLFPADHPMLHRANRRSSRRQPSPDSVAMEIIWARFPANDPVLDDAAWRDIDETQIDPAVRRELLNNGIRAGVICGVVAAAIDQVLHQGASPESPTNRRTKADIAKSQTPNCSPSRSCTAASLRVRRNQRTRNPSLRRLSLAAAAGERRRRTGRPHLRTSRGDLLPPRRSATRSHGDSSSSHPNCNHGAPQLRFTGGDDGILQQASLNERKVFDQLAALRADSPRAKCSSS